MARKGEKTKKEWLAEEVAKAVGAGRAVAVETVDFNQWRGYLAFVRRTNQ